jgi:NADH:ubiquinone oxidoreductase subunit 2 (subunit N)
MLNSIFLFFDASFFESYGFSLILCNILIYLLTLTVIFYIFFFFNLNNFLNISNIKLFSTSNFFYLAIILSLLSLVGMPPLLGFVGKFLLVIFINLKSQYYIFCLFVLLNLLMIYFYIQNFRFLVKKTNSNNYSYVFQSNELNLPVLRIIVFLMFFTLFGIFLFDDFFLIINSLLFF